MGAALHSPLGIEEMVGLHLASQPRTEVSLKGLSHPMFLHVGSIFQSRTNCHIGTTLIPR